MSYQEDFSQNKYARAALLTAESHHDLRFLARMLCIYEEVVGECTDEELNRIGGILAKHIPNYRGVSAKQENETLRIYQDYYVNLFNDIHNWLKIDRKILSNLVIELFKLDIVFESYRIVELLFLVKEKFVSPKDFGIVLKEMSQNTAYVAEIIEHLGVMMVDSSGAILKVIHELIGSAPKEIQQYIDGNEKILGFFVGKVMKQMDPKPDPAEVNRLLRIELDKLKE